MKGTCPHRESVRQWELPESGVCCQTEGWRRLGLSHGGDKGECCRCGRWCVQQQEQASPSTGLGGGHSGAGREGMWCPAGRRAQQGLYPHLYTEVTVSSLIWVMSV